MSIRASVVKTALLVPLLLAACDRPDDQRTGTIGERDVLEARAQLDPAVTAELDSGNTAYRERDYERALEHYNAAVRMDDRLAAGWFGIYMAQLALGNEEAAEAAMEEARLRAPGANLMHPDADAPAPGGHPALEDTVR